MSTEGARIADRYELVSRLGEGGRGAVWRARDTKLGRAVAVKLLSAASVGSDVARSRLIREARAAAALEHEGIVRVYDVGETDDGGAFLVMELIRGKSLRDLMIGGSLGLATRATILADAGRALAFAHAAGIVHRDVKPDNVMVREDGRVVVVDFGVAKPVASDVVGHADTVAAQTGGALTGAGQLVGTPAYLAPEQARGLDVSHATDQFALAVTAYEALSGKLPWKGHGVADIVASVLRDESPPISSGGHVPASFDAVLSRALAKAPSDRFPDMEAFVDAFEAAAVELPEDEVSTSRPSGRAKRTPISLRDTAAGEGSGERVPPVDSAPRVAEVSSTKVSAASTHGGQAATPAPTPPSRRPSRAIIAAGALGVLGVVGWLAMRGPAATSSSSSSAASAAPSASTALPANDVIACPMFEVVGVEEPWLGASAATLACQRIQIAYGGGDARTLVPAELAGAQRELSGDKNAGLHEKPDARARNVEAAKQRAPRWIDGRLEKDASSYSVKMVLRSASGSEIAHAEGRATEIYEAVGAAIASLGPATIATTPGDLAKLLEQLDVGSVAAAYALLDMRTAILIEDLQALRGACDAIAQRTDLLPRVAYLARIDCVRKLRRGTVDEPPPAIDESTVGALITTSLAQGRTGGPDAVRERAQRLERAATTGATSEARARLDAAAAEIYNLVGDERARHAARRAISASPKATDWRTNAWHRLAFASEGDSGLWSALQAWHPWEPISYSAGVGSASTPEVVNATIYRAYLLSQRSVYALYYGQQLLVRGKVEAARSVAESTNDDLLRVHILLGEAKYAAALSMVPKLLAALKPSDETASVAFQLADLGASAALTLERPPMFVDDIVTRWVDSEPHHVVDGVIPFLSLVGACVLAPRPTGKRCIDRLQHLREAGKLPIIFQGAESVLIGAARAVADDYIGATKVWRTMLRAPGWIQDPLREVMAVVFDRGGAPDLGDEVDAQALATIDYPRTAHIAWVRSAKRAVKRGDMARAKKLAQAVVDKWRFADEDIPSLREMRAILAKP